MRRYTNSEIKTWKRCHREWYLGYFRALTRTRQEVAGKPATLGTRVHRVLRHLYDPTRLENDDYVIACLRDWIEADVVEYPEQEKEIREEGNLALLMVEGYLEWLAEEGADEGLDFVAAEERVEVDLGQLDNALQDVALLAKVDARVQRIVDGAVAFLDHKTVQSFPSPGLLAMDEQMRFYGLVLFLRALVEGREDRIDGALYNMLRKVKRTARAKPPFYRREPIRWNVHVLRDFWQRVIGTIEEIRRAEDALHAGAHPSHVAAPNPSRDCEWRCQFYPVCSLLDDASIDSELVIRSSYSESDPLARYDDATEGEE